MVDLLLKNSDQNVCNMLFSKLHAFFFTVMFQKVACFLLEKHRECLSRRTSNIERKLLY